MAERSVIVTLGGREWEISRARLGGFLRLQQARESINRGVEEAANGWIVDGIFEFLRVSIPDLEASKFYTSPWHDVFYAYSQIEELNRLPHGAEFAILKFPTKTSHRSVPWDNPLRAVIIWIHLIAKNYSWSRSEIEHMWPEEAIAFVQEIMADEQMDREFVHMLSAVAYEYNKTTKKSQYRPLARPMWMVMQSVDDVITMLRKDFLPVGNVIYPKEADERLKPEHD